MMAKFVCNQSIILNKIIYFYLKGFPNPWDVILNKRRFEYAMVCEKFYIFLFDKYFVLFRNLKDMMILLI